MVDPEWSLEETFHLQLLLRDPSIFLLLNRWKRSIRRSDARLEGDEDPKKNWRRVGYKSSWLSRRIVQIWWMLCNAWCNTRGWYLLYNLRKRCQLRELRWRRQLKGVHPSQIISQCLKIRQPNPSLIDTLPLQCFLRKRLGLNLGLSMRREKLK